MDITYKGVPIKEFLISSGMLTTTGALATTGFATILMCLTFTLFVEEQNIKSIRSYLAESFQDISDEDLSWLSFWGVLSKVKVNT
ncbi:hypothetical protein SAMN05216317_11627 [Nitrosomonas eutropha]|uniref:hypothetical protein n=1 Tax=Nitrosomonas TaxID=914 RepID=UPI00089BB9E0|nr:MULTISPECIES: hypothetical protein [Nitrosomonas]MXS81341.1 hypothetical protein [Nitrosomonas sp. GH22]SDW87281.1 hypothetical protein SAMN05216317_11627 [Nitrosomonas eutropha]